MTLGAYREKRESMESLLRRGEAGRPKEVEFFGRGINVRRSANRLKTKCHNGSRVRLCQGLTWGKNKGQKIR